MSIVARSIHVKNSNLCFNCLGFAHRTRECMSICRCKRCAKTHHTMLHREQVNNGSDLAQAPPPAPPTSDVSVNHVKPHPAVQASQSMTSQVILEAPSGKQIVARALLDSGAGLSLSSLKEPCSS